MNFNLLLAVDSYKHSHFNQYPKDMKGMFAYVEPRKGDYKNIVFFGLQSILMKYLSKPITMEDINEAEPILLNHGVPFNRAGWEYIVREHNGMLPIKISALPEGTIVPIGVPIIAVESTDMNVPWVVSFIETVLLKVWYPTTVATLSWHIKQILNKYAEKTASRGFSTDFQLHDFGARGVSSEESAEIGGSAHLVNFKGSDTLSSIRHIKEYYNYDSPSYSIPASEHSTITAWGKEHEGEAYKNLLDIYAKKSSVAACVSDSYDLKHAIESYWCGSLKRQVIESGAVIVIRPDSGDPVDTSAMTITLLDKYFGSSINDKGFKVLNHVRVVYGDGINQTSIENILDKYKSLGFSSENITFGMGGALLQQVNRDTLSFAMKTSNVYVGGKWCGVNKDPITDPNKASRKGHIITHYNPEARMYEVVDSGAYTDKNNAMQCVFLNGRVNAVSFEIIRKRATMVPETVITYADPF